MTLELIGLTLADPPDRWSALGFTVVDSTVTLGVVTLALGVEGEGIVAWSVTGVEADVDGLPSRPAPPPASAIEHPNTAIGLDHVVVVTDDFDRTATALTDARLELTRTLVRSERGERRKRRERRMGFRRLGPAILELVEAPDTGGRARFWGLTIVVREFEPIRDTIGEIRPAVQPGRQIATLSERAGLTQPVAFMDAERR